MSMPCGGKGNCGKCRVTVVGNVSAPTVTEMRHLLPEDLQKGIRLACMTHALGDCVVTTTPQGEGQICVDTNLPENLSQTLAIPVFDKYGVAVDIGTTTLAACLYDREWVQLAVTGCPNPQGVWGADVVTRMENAMDGRDRDLADLVRRGVTQMLIDLASHAGIPVSDIDHMVITGNTVMLHLLTQTSVEPLTHAPFVAEDLFGRWVAGVTLGLDLLPPQAQVYLMPCVSAFVGGDLVAALEACDFCYGQETKLLVDIGTNGEMALWHKEKLYVCSTAAGPAFEGAGIAMGMAGGEGAVDHVSLCNGVLTPHVIGDVPPVGICGSGIVDSVACFLDAELMDETGYLEDDPTPVACPVSLTQADIRAVQLAKSAIGAGLDTLMHSVDVTADQVSKLYVAGGFGSYLNVHNAGRIGLLPHKLTSRVEVLGNAALAGATMLLMDRAGIPHAEGIAKSAQVVDLATNAYFAEAFMQGMMFEI